jgi:hypothetical protein
LATQLSERRGRLATAIPRLNKASARIYKLESNCLVNGSHRTRNSDAAPKVLFRNYLARYEGMQSNRSNLIGLSVSTIIGVLTVISLVNSSSAQTQASCQFSAAFNLQQAAGGKGFLVFPKGVNDYATVVGFAQNDVDNSSFGFARFSGGGFSFYKHDSVDTAFEDRDNNGTNVGETISPTGNATPFTLKGSTFTPLTLNIGGTTQKNFTLDGMNDWETTVGVYEDASGAPHGFKRYSNGGAIALNFPGAAETVANAINDNGTIVGWYSKQAPPHRWKHGFIYHNGQWASVSYPSTSVETSLEGISNSNLILANTSHGSTGVFSYIYVNGTFKKIVMPNSTLPTFAIGMSRVKGLITGHAGMTGFIATCK